jgi:hypothetical protein
LVGAAAVRMGLGSSVLTGTTMARSQKTEMSMAIWKTKTAPTR